MLSLDVQDTVIHNVFETLQLNETTPAGILGVTSPINVARLRAQLLSLKYTYAPLRGWGYNLAIAAERSMVDGLPSSIYAGSPGFPVNDVQICGNGLFTPGIPTCIPYLKGYGQATYSWKTGAFFELGVDYEGKNNAYFQPPFALVDATYRVPIRPELDFQVSAENLLNTNNYENLPAPNAGVALVAGSSTGQTTYQSTVIPAVPRTLHFQFQYHMGR